MITVVILMMVAGQRVMRWAPPLGMNETRLRRRVRIDGPASVTVRPRSRLPLGAERLRRDSGLAAHGPLLERLVGGEDHRPGAPVALTDEMEESVGGGGYLRRARLDHRHPDPVDHPRGFIRDLRHSPVGSSAIQKDLDFEPLDCVVPFGAVH